MSGKPKPSPKLLQWRLECLGHSFIEGLAALLPGPWVFRLGEVAGALAWHLMPARRAIVLRNLRIAFAGEQDSAEIQRLTRASFRRSGANLVSAAHTARLTPENVRRVVHIENLALLEQAQARGKGIVLLLAHMGNWELLTKLIHIFPPGSKCGAFYRPLNNPLLDARVLARRQADGTRMFSKRDPFHQVTGFLRDGGIVGILADQRVGSQGEPVHFFGRITRASPLPGLLARRAKAEVLGLSLVTESPGKWKAVLRPIASPPTTDNCMQAIEQGMRSSPADVFWLQERWKVFVKRFRPFSVWVPPGTPAGSKPHRALIWLAGAPERWKPDDDWFHPDVTYEAALAPGAPLPVWLPADTRIHRLPPAVKPQALGNTLDGIDRADPLPLDFALVPKSFARLARGSAGLVPVISLA